MSEHEVASVVIAPDRRAYYQWCGENRVKPADYTWVSTYESAQGLKQGGYYLTVGRYWQIPDFDLIVRTLRMGGYQPYPFSEPEPRNAVRAQPDTAAGPSVGDADRGDGGAPGERARASLRPYRARGDDERAGR